MRVRKDFNLTETTNLSEKFNQLTHTYILLITA